MATFIVKYSHIIERTMIVEASSEENAKLLGTDEGIEAGNDVLHDNTTSDIFTVKQLDEVNYKDV